MKQYKAFIIGFILAVIPINSAYGILGFGVQGGQGLFTVGARSLEDPSGIASMATAEFSNSLNLGLYAYLDIIPFFDLDNETVWGATSMILSEFKTVLKGAS